jgi:hypothetical protein
VELGGELNIPGGVPLCPLEKEATRRKFAPEELSSAWRKRGEAVSHVS